MSEIILAGLAVPFGETVPYGDGFLQVQAGAFDAWLHAPDCDCRLIFGSHADDAEILSSTMDRSLHLYADRHGLWFRAHIGAFDERCGIQQLITQRRKPLDQVSANFCVHRETSDRYLSCARRRLLKVGADHIAIVDKGAFGAKTGVWPANLPLDEAPWRIRCLDETFQDAISSSSTRLFNFKARS